MTPLPGFPVYHAEPGWPVNEVLFVRPVFKCVLLGAPRTKKNHGRVVQRWDKAKGQTVPKHVPSAAHEYWFNRVLPWLNKARVEHGDRTIKAPVNCRAIFYRDALAGDAIGYYQALADLLQAARVIEDDKLIISWWGTWLLKDAARPRIEFVLEEFGQRL